MNRNKQKGKRFEEYIAEKLRKTFLVDKRYITRAKSSGISQEEFGDIVLAPSIIEKFPFIIECKFGYDIKLEYYIGKQSNNKSNPLRKFLVQVLKEYNSYTIYAKKYNINNKLIPILIFSGAYKDIYVSFIESITKELDKKLYNKLKKFNYIKTTILDYNLITVDFNDFMSLYQNQRRM